VDMTGSGTRHSSGWNRMSPVTVVISRDRWTNSASSQYERVEMTSRVHMLESTAKKSLLKWISVTTLWLRLDRTLIHSSHHVLGELENSTPQVKMSPSEPHNIATRWGISGYLAFCRPGEFCTYSLKRRAMNGPLVAFHTPRIVIMNIAVS